MDEVRAERDLQAGHGNGADDPAADLNEISRELEGIMRRLTVIQSRLKDE